MLPHCLATCTASTDWTTCQCAIEDGPKGAFQLVTGFFSLKILKQFIDVAAEDICNEKTMTQIKDDILKAIPSKLTPSQLAEFTSAKKELDNCLKPLGSSVDKVIDKASTPLSSYLNRRYFS
ncbi:hypothetical protein Aduo_008090 [Ancylostoma duodenale]